MPAVRPRPPTLRTGIALLGPINGINLTFTFPEVVLKTATSGPCVYFNGQRVSEGDDYSLSESGGLGTGFDTLTTLFTPRVGDRLTGDYQVP